MMADKCLILTHTRVLSGRGGDGGRGYLRCITVTLTICVATTAARAVARRFLAENIGVTHGMEFDLLWSWFVKPRVSRLQYTEW